MQCKNHPDTPATARCAGCAESFCDNCLVEIHGEKYCGACKVLAIKAPPPLEGLATEPCKEAGEALTYAIISLFCFGIILGPIALIKASKARERIAGNPRLTGSGKATAATIIAVIAIVLFIAGVLVRVSSIR